MALDWQLDSSYNGASFMVTSFSCDTFFWWIRYNAMMHFPQRLTIGQRFRCRRVHSDIIFWWKLLCLIWRWFWDRLKLLIGWRHAQWSGACRLIFKTKWEGILVEIKGSRVRTPKITFLVVDASVQQKLCVIKSRSEKCVDSKINGHTERIWLWTP